MKKVGLIFLVILIIVCSFVFILSGKKPYKNLKVSDIESATVHLIPPDKKITITDFEEVVEYLNDIVIYNKDNSYVEYEGQGVIFNFVMADGSEEEIMAYNPFIIINGVGYKTKSEPCNKLSSYANKLLNDLK